MDADSNSGILTCENGTVRYSSRQFGSWSLPVSSIQVVGEFTNEDGPHIDDYFLVFLTSSRSEWWQASIYAEGRDDFLRALEKELPGLGAPGLSNSTSFKSRVLWPPAHQGKPLFTFSKPTRGSSFFGRVLTALDSKVEQRIAANLD